jgi:hypothetical protein
MFNFQATALERLNRKDDLLKLFERHSTKARLLLTPELMERWTVLLYQKALGFRQLQIAVVNHPSVRSLMAEDMLYRLSWTTIARVNQEIRAVEGWGPEAERRAALLENLGLEALNEGGRR